MNLGLSLRSKCSSPIDGSVSLSHLAPLSELQFQDDPQGDQDKRKELWILTAWPEENQNWALFFPSRVLQGNGDSPGMFWSLNSPHKARPLCSGRRNLATCRSDPRAALAGLYIYSWYRILAGHWCHPPCSLKSYPERYCRSMDSWSVHAVWMDYRIPAVSIQGIESFSIQQYQRTNSLTFSLTLPQTGMS